MYPEARIKVVYCRYTTKDSMPLQYPPPLVNYLVRNGVQHVAVVTRWKTRPVAAPLLRTPIMYTVQQHINLGISGWLNIAIPQI